MKIFDFAVNTQDATIDDFNNAVDNIRYMNARSGWSRDSYLGEETPKDFQEQPLTFEEYENWIKSIYIFIERCIDFYPPTSNFLFPYRKVDIKNELEHYLEIYIIIEFLKSQDSLMFAYDYYDSDGMTRMEKELSSFVNVSKIIRAIIISYQSVVGFDINKYKNFGASFKMSDFSLDCFPFASARYTYDGPYRLSFAYIEYRIQNGKLYRMKKTDFCNNKERFDAYLESHPEHKEKYNKAIEKFNNDNKTIIEKIDKEIEKYSNINKDLNNKKTQPEAKLKQLADEADRMNRKSALVCLFYVMSGKVNEIKYKASAYEQEINRIENQINNNNEQIKKLSLQKKEKDVSDVIREFILSIPDFLEYKEV